MNFSQEQIITIQGKHGEQNHFIFAVMLKFFEVNGRFPRQKEPELHNIIATVRKTLHLSANINGDWNNRSTERFKQEIRLLFGFRVATLDDKAAFVTYCETYIFPYAFKPNA